MINWDNMVLELNYNVLLTAEFLSKLDEISKRDGNKLIDDANTEILKEAHELEKHFILFDPKYHAFVYMYFFFLKADFAGKRPESKNEKPSAARKLHTEMVVFILTNSTSDQMDDLVFDELDVLHLPDKDPNNIKFKIRDNYVTKLLPEIRKYFCDKPRRVLEKFKKIKKTRQKSITDVLKEEKRELFFSYFYAGVSYDLYYSWLKMIKLTSNENNVCIYDMQDLTNPNSDIARDMPLYYWLPTKKKPIEHGMDKKRRRLKCIFGDKYNDNVLQRNLIVSESFIDSLRKCEKSPRKFFVSPIEVQYLHKRAGHLMGMVFHVQPPYYMYIFDSSPYGGRITQLFREFKSLVNFDPAAEIFQKYEMRHEDFSIYTYGRRHQYPPQNLESMTIHDYMRNNKGFCAVFTFLYLHYLIIYPESSPQHILHRIMNRDNIHEFVRLYAESLLQYIMRLPVKEKSWMRVQLVHMMKQRHRIYFHRFAIKRQEDQQALIAYFQRYDFKLIIKTFFNYDGELLVKDKEFFDNPETLGIILNNPKNTLDYVYKYNTSPDRKKRDWDLVMMLMALYKEDLKKNMIKLGNKLINNNIVSENYKQYGKRLLDLAKTHELFIIK